MDIWQWTLTKAAIAPCFVRDVLDMRPASDSLDFFWLGYTPCRTVLLVGMVVAVQTYDKRAIYTIDDGTAVIDCVLRHPPKAPPPRSPSRVTGNANADAQRSSPKKRLVKATAPQPMDPPPPVTEPGYPVRVVGKVVRHWESKQIHADSIDPCPSSLDEIAHLERVTELHKSKYSLPAPFVPPKPALRAPPSISRPDTGQKPDTTIFSTSSRTPVVAAPYTLPELPCVPIPLQSRNQPPPSPTTPSIASPTPSSPCKHSSPIKPHKAGSQPKLRHPSRLHTRDLTANTFRLYIKHYMDNAPSPFSVTQSLPVQNACGSVSTPTKRSRLSEGEREGEETTPRPRHWPRTGVSEMDSNEHHEDAPTLGFTLSHLRRVPELALLAARVVRAETRKRDKAERSQTQGAVPGASTSSRRGAATELPRRKIKRLFSWAVVKLYEEGSIVLWDGEVRPLPVPPLPVGENIGVGTSGIWNDDTNTLGSIEPSVGSTSALYNLSASASLYSHYHVPRRRGEGDASVVDDDADPATLSDPGLDEEAYVPLNPQFLAGYVREAISVLRRRRTGGRTKSATAEDVLRYMQRMDGRWARVGVWAIEEALAVLGAE